MEAGEEAAEYNNELYKQVSDEMMKNMTDAGVTVYELDDAMFKEFQDASEKLYADYEANGTWTKGLYEQIQGIINS